MRASIFLYAALIAAASALSTPPLVCVNDSSPTCVVSSTSVTLASNFTLDVGDRSLLLFGVSVTGQPCRDVACDDVALVLRASGNVSLVNTSLHVASVLIDGGNHVYIDKQSTIDASGMGPIGPTFLSDVANGIDGTGGGHGGAGSIIWSCRPQGVVPPPPHECGLAFGFATAAAPASPGGGSVGFGEAGSRVYARGGGIVAVSSANGSATLRGVIRADGGFGTHVDITRCGRAACGPGGGAGGSVYLTAAQTLLLTQGAFVSAVGADAAEGGGGGGGLIAFRAAALVGASQTAINVTGGLTLASDGASCAVGGTGLWWVTVTAARYGDTSPLSESLADADASRLHSECRQRWATARRVRRLSASYELPSWRNTTALGPRRRNRRGHASPATMRTAVRDRVHGHDGSLRGDLTASSWSPNRAREMVFTASTVAGGVSFSAICDSQMPHLRRQPLPRRPGSTSTAITGVTVVYCVSAGAAVARGTPLTQSRLPVDSYFDGASVVLAYCAWDTSALPLIALQSLSAVTASLTTGEVRLTLNDTLIATDSTRISTAGETQGLGISAGGDIRIASSAVSAGVLDVTSAQNIEVDVNGYLRFAARAALGAQSLDIENDVSQVDVPSTSTTLTIVSINVTMENGSRARAGSIFISSVRMAIDGFIDAVDALGEQDMLCPPVDSGLPATPAVRTVQCGPGGAWDAEAGFTAWLGASDVVDVSHAGIVEGAAVRICARRVRVDSGGVVSASGLGCIAESGAGAGRSDETGSKPSGGGHGGAGGYGIAPGGDVNPGGFTNDDVTAPRLLGSGGGGAASGGAGGGVVWLDVLDDVALNGAILAVGEDGAPGDRDGGAGGAGGVVVFSAMDVTGMGVIDVSGGIGGATGSGGGGGGLMHVQWLGGGNGSDDFHGIVVNIGAAGGGSGGGSGDDGAAMSYPSCLAGQGGAFCLPCLAGSAAPLAGSNAPCPPCQPGSVSNVTGAMYCTPCVDGYAPTAGLTQCVPCPDGFSPNNEHTLCDVCAAGHGGADCLPCGAGTFSSGTNGTADCQQCPRGTFSAPVSSSCQVCAPATFCAHPGCDRCTACPEGEVSDPPYYDCRACSAGSEAVDGVCVGCPPNTYAPEASVECKPCDLGFFSLENASICSACPALPAHAHFLPWSTAVTSAGTLAVNRPLLSAAWAVDTLQPPRPQLPWGVNASATPPPPYRIDACAFVCEVNFLAYPSCLTALEIAFRGAGSWPALVVLLLAGIVAVTPTLFGRQSVTRGVSWVSGSAARTAAQALRDTTFAVEVDAYWGDATYDELARARLGGDGCSGPCATICGCGRRPERGKVAGGTGSSFTALPANVIPAARGAPTSRFSLQRVLGGVGVRVTRSGLAGASVDDDGYVPVHATEDTSEVAASLAAPGRSGVLSVLRSWVAMTFSASSQHEILDDRGPPLLSMRRLSASAGVGRGGGAAAIHSPGVPLRVEDLQRHLHRLYFDGTNDPQHPLRLPSNIPHEVAAAVSKPEYETHVAECARAAAWGPWETILSYGFRLLMPPAAILFEAARRREHVARLAVIHSSVDHLFLRNTRARALGDCAVFGASRDGTLAWLDILVVDVTTDDSRGVPVGAPRLPAVLPLAGDGSFMSPLRLELEDVFVAASLALLAPDFGSLATGLNDVLRVLKGPSLAPPARCNGCAAASWRSRRSGIARPASDERLDTRAGSVDDDDDDEEDEEEEDDDDDRGGGYRVRFEDDDNTAQNGARGLNGGAVALLGKRRVRRSTKLCCHGCACSGRSGATDPSLDEQATLLRVLEYVSIANGVLRSRSIAASTAEAAAAAIASAAVVDGDGVASGTARDARAVATAARRNAPFGFGPAAYECSIHLGMLPRRGRRNAQRRLCMILLPTEEPPDPISGEWPFFLPYGARIVTPASVAPVAVMPHPVAQPSVLPSPAAPLYRAASQTAVLAVDGSPSRQLAAGASTPLRLAAVTPDIGSPGAFGGSSGRRSLMMSPGTTNTVATPAWWGAVPTPARGSAVRGGVSPREENPATYGTRPPHDSAHALRSRGDSAFSAACSTFSGVFPRLTNARVGAIPCSRTLMGATTLLLLPLVLADICLTALCISAFVQLAPSAAVASLSIPPLLLAVSPVLGLVTLTRRSSTASRLHAACTAASLIPAIVCAILCVIFLETVDVRIGLVVPAALLVVKLMLLPASAARVAHLDLQQDIDGVAAGAVVPFVRTLFAEDSAAESAAALRTG